MSPTQSANAICFSDSNSWRPSGIADLHDSADSFILPSPPNPSLDPQLAVPAGNRDDDCSLASPNALDVFSLGPIAALKLLCCGIEALVRVTGDIPPTSPSTHAPPPNMRGMQAEKDSIARSNSFKNLAEIKPQAISGQCSKEIDGVNFRKSPVSCFEEQLSAQPYIIIGDNAEPINVQHSAITRKFYSKQPPPISLEDYIMRIHKFCPMSTAVYLATSFYIHKLAVEERAIPVTRRNCHRLLLAGLRVAMKALEDLSYPHSRFSKVGGVSENELARLEISFCFLTNFEFKTSKETLLQHAIMLKESSTLQGGFNFIPRMPFRAHKRSKVALQETAKELTADA